MTRHELELANRSNDALKRAERDLDALKEFKVRGVLVGRGIVSDTYRIESGGNTGTGSISSIGWTDEMEAAVTTAFKKVFEDRIDAAHAELARLGVADAAE